MCNPTGCHFKTFILAVSILSFAIFNAFLTCVIVVHATPSPIYMGLTFKGTAQLSEIAIEKAGKHTIPPLSGTFLGHFWVRSNVCVCAWVEEQDGFLILLGNLKTLNPPSKTTTSCSSV